MGRAACSLRARRRVSRPEMPGMRTSEIIMLMGSPRRISRACSPEATGSVSNPWLVRKESSRLRCPGSSSTIRMRGAVRAVLPASGGMASTPGGELQMGEAEDRAPGLVGEAFDLPAVGQDDLLNHGQAEAGAFVVCGEIRLEDVRAMMRRNAGAVVAHFEDGLVGALPGGGDADFAVLIDGLDGVEQQVEERLPEQLFVGFNGELLIRDLEADALF